MRNDITTSPGRPLPLGAHSYKNGVSFSIFSRNAESVTLVLFDSSTPDSGYKEFDLDPVVNKTGDIWHIWIEGITEGQHYGYRIDGPYEPKNGHRFNKHKLLLDPYTRALSINFTWDLMKARGYDPDDPEEDLSLSEIDNIQYSPRGIVIEDYTGFEEKPFSIPPEETIIYEVHVKGFTCHDSSDIDEKGTFKGLTKKIPYLKELGVTAVELMPIQEFDELENININPVTGERLKNYWGYSTLSFFSPKGTFASDRTNGKQVEEFREMVKAFHEAGIEVILDIVFNHTAEGDQKGPTISFRGIDNNIYYILQEDKRFYKNYSGCGNTVNCNHPLVRDFILDALRYWVTHMHVDGFRFDLASILGRDQDGSILSNPPLIERIEEDPILRNAKIIAEAWDAAGAYQVGSFPGRWAEWNGKYRDDVRRFWKGEKGSIGAFATRITGSSDLYHGSDVGPCRGINFVTCHDGFTLYDLVSYKEKHNIENGENNRDGENHNISQNMGFEGSPAPADIELLRTQLIKNFIATLFLSQGIPMLLSGDEFKRTQGGNNNTYCQDNETSWINWQLLEENRDIFRFTQHMIRFRKQHPILRRKQFFTGKKKNGYTTPDVTWHSQKIGHPDWSEKNNTLGMLINGNYAREDGFETDSDMYIIFNASMKEKEFSIPKSPSGKEWRIAIDTSKNSPDDISDTAPLFTEDRYHVKKLSLVTLVTD